MQSELKKVCNIFLNSIVPSKEAPLIAIVRGKRYGSIIVMNSGDGAMLNYGTEEEPDWKHLASLSNEQLDYIREEHSFLTEACDIILSERRNASM